MNSNTSASPEVGPSPRRRGALGDLARPVTGGGAIPAQAGSTLRSLPSTGKAGGHPRAGGEHFTEIASEAAEKGPSPRRRGALPVPARRDCQRGAIPAQAGSTDRPGPWELGVGAIPAQAGSTAMRRVTRWGRWGHPRAGGEHVGGGAVADVEGGPSPRRRGARDRLAGRLGGGGAIPAQAGSTTRSSRRCKRARGHPRAGGEHRGTRGAPDDREGAIPAQAGSTYAEAGGDPGVGAIPAQAGSTRRVYGGPLPWGGHPRAGGEHSAGNAAGTGQAGPSRAGGEHVPKMIEDDLAMGPSPRRRGARRTEPGPLLDGGAIPAQAGSTPAGLRSDAEARGHPRAGGEHRSRPALYARHGGPSPRRRGAPVAAAPAGGAGAGHPRAGGEHRQRAGLRRLVRGAIPAQAGSTGSRCSATPAPRGHPRAGGEHLAANVDHHAWGWAIPAQAGARPRRGRPRRGRGAIPAQAGSTRPRRPRRRHAGAIPAQAGSTPAAAGLARRAGGHPRAGGEHVLIYAYNHSETGPSPRRRGALAPGGRQVGGVGAIPAQAGSTYR